MHSLSKLKSAAGAATYFRDRDDYYLSDHSPSEWWGVGAREIGLVGEVDAQTFRDILEGKIKGVQEYRAGEKTVAGKRGRTRKIPNHQPGWDSTFSAPKPVSIAALVRGDTRIIAAHDAAVREAMKVIEGRIAITKQRVGKGRYVWRFGDGIVAAMFRHASSRSLDPQLHTHVVIPNIMRDPATGKWVSIDSREGLYKVHRDAETAYTNALAASLRELGYEVEWRINDAGFPEIDLPEISAEERELFSTRKQEIDAKLAEGGITRAEAGRQERQEATLATRSPKQRVPAAELHQQWVTRLATLGDKIRAFVRPESAPRADPNAAADEAVRRAAASISERNARFILPDLLTEARIFSQGRASEPELQAAVQRAAEKGSLIVTDTLARVPGGDLKEVPGFTTRAGQQIETAMLETVRRLHEGGEQIMSATDARAAVEAANTASGGRLTSEHQSASRTILSGTSRIEIVQGLAGSAKTTGVLKVVADAARASGWEVQAMAPTSSAADTLGAAIGAKSRTVAAVNLSDTKRARQSLWIVDEAGLLGAADMQKLLAKADAAGAKVVLVGDVKQIGSVQAGRAFDQIQQADPGHTHTITRIVRQRNETLRAAVEAAARGDVNAAFQGVEIVEHKPDFGDDDRQEATDEAREAARKAAIDDVASRYLRDTAEGAETLVVALAVKDRDEINAAIQAARAEAGEVSDVRETVVLRPKGWTAEQQADSARYQAGDVILARKNVAHLAKGQTAEVIAVVDGKVTVRNRGDGQEWAFDPQQYKSFTAYDSEKIGIGTGDRIAFRGKVGAQDEAHEWHAFKNGDVATVTGRTDDGSLIVEDRGGKRYTVAAAAPLQVDLGYASTADAAQGKTVDRVIGYVRSTMTNLANQQRLYVLASRARDNATLVTDNVKLLAERVAKRSGKKETSMVAATEREEADAVAKLPGYELPPRDAVEARTAGNGNEPERPGADHDREQARDPVDARTQAAGSEARSDAAAESAATDTDKSHETSGRHATARGDDTAARSADRAQAANEPEPDRQGHRVGFVRDVAHATAAVARPAMARQIQKLRDAIHKSKQEARPTRITRDQAAIASGLALHERYENEDRLLRREPPTQKDWKRMVKRHGEAVGPDGTRYTQDDKGRVFTNRMLRADRREIVRRDFMDPKQRVQRRIVGKPGDTHVMVSKDHGKSWKRADLFDSLATRYDTWRRDRMQQRLELDRLKWQTSGGRETRDSRWLANEALITDERLQKSWFKRKIDWDAMADRNGVAYDKLGYRYAHDDKGRIYGEALTKRGYYVMRMAEGREAIEDMRKHAHRGHELAHDYRAHGEHPHHLIRRAWHGAKYRSARARLEKVIGDGRDRELSRLTYLICGDATRRWKANGRHESSPTDEMAMQAMKHQGWGDFNWDESARKHGILFDRDGRRYAVDQFGFARSEALEKKEYHYRHNAEAVAAKVRQSRGSRHGPLAWWAEQRTREKVWDGVKAERERLGRIVDAAEKQRAQEAARIRDEIPFGSGATISVPGTKLRVDDPARDNSRGR